MRTKHSSSELHPCVFAAISCRKHHRTSPSAHFAPGFDDEGSPIARSGYHVACKKHSDCMPCGRHPLSEYACLDATSSLSIRLPLVACARSQHYRCQKRYVLYDTVFTNDDGDLWFLNETGGSASAFDIDLEEGALTGKTGICVDIDSSYNEGCSSRAGSAVKDGIVGCAE